MILLISANSSSCSKLVLKEEGRKGRKRFISLMQATSSFTLIWIGFQMFSSQLVISSLMSVGHILVMNSHMVLLK